MKKITTFVFMLAIAAAFSTSALAQGEKRIQFAKGKASATVTGSLKKDGQTAYKLNARKGQKLTVTFKSNVGKNAGIVIFAPDPAGENKLIFGEDGLGSKTMTFDLDLTGDYEIEVGSTRACTYTLLVKIN